MELGLCRHFSMVRVATIVYFWISSCMQELSQITLRKAVNATTHRELSSDGSLREAKLAS